MSFDFGSLENKKKSSSASAKKTTSANPSSKNNAPSIDFSNLGGSSNNTQSKPSGKPSPSAGSSKKTSSKSSATRAKGKKGSLIKGVDNTVLFAGIGGIALLLIIIVCVCFSGNEPKSKPVDNVAQRNKYINQAYELVNKHEYEKAIAAYEKAYKADPHDGYPPTQIAIIYRTNLHDEAKAEEWTRKADAIITNVVESSTGASAAAYEERAEKIKKMREAKNKR